MDQIAGLPTEELVQRYRDKVRFAGAQHGKVRQALQLKENTKSNPGHLFVIEGIWAHEKALAAGLEIDSFIFCPAHIYSPEAIALAEQFLEKAPDCYLVSEKVFARLSERDGPDGLLSICRFPVKTLDDLEIGENCLLVVLDGLEIPGNVGTILRSIDGADADGAIICNRRARITHPKIIKGSMGAAFMKPVVEAPDTAELIKWLREHNFDIYLTDTRAEKRYFEYDYKGRAAIVAGSERYGITKEWYNGETRLISIPMLGACDSLNVAISTTIVLYEASMKQKGFRQ